MHVAGLGVAGCKLGVGGFQKVGLLAVLCYPKRRSVFDLFLPIVLKAVALGNIMVHLFPPLSSENLM